LSITRLACLQTGQLAGRLVEDRRGAAQLAALRNVLRVVDGDEVAACKGHGDIERARLGAGRALRRHDDLMRRARRMGPQRRPGFGVVALDDEFHVELGARIIETVDRARELLGDGRLPVKRDDDRVDRQPHVGKP
jgi:hypothetical protein